MADAEGVFKVKITERIISDAEAEARTIAGAGAAKAESMIAAAKAEAAKKAQEIEKNAAEKAADIKRRKASMTSLDERKAMLGVRRKKVDEAFLRAETALMESDGYVGFMERLLKECAEDGGQVCFAKGDAKLAESGMIEKSGFALTRGADAENISGGFIFINSAGTMVTDCSCRAVINEKKAAAESGVADILFKGRES